MIDALEACVIRSGCSGFAYQHSHGLSIYFPWAFVSPDYRNLQFAQAHGLVRLSREAHQRDAT